MATILHLPDRGLTHWGETEFVIRKLLKEEGRDQDLVDHVCAKLHEVYRHPVMTFPVSRETAAASADVIRNFQSALSYLAAELLKREILLYEFENGHGKTPPKAA